MQSLMTIISVAVVASIGSGCAVGMRTAAVPCSLPQMSTEGWEQVTAHRGHFDILLPPVSLEPLAQCEDSWCGRIQVGSWTLRYDGGEMAGPGFPLSGHRPTMYERPKGREFVRRCEEEVNGRPMAIEVYRVPLKGGEFSPEMRGMWIATATTAYKPGIGLYLSTTGRTPADLGEFLVAVRTVNLLWP